MSVQIILHMTVKKQRIAEFLDAIVRNGDRANVTEIRMETGFSRNQIDYWFPQLVDDGLIEKRYDEQGRRVAVLTEYGKSEIRKGNFGRGLLETEEKGDTEITLSKTKFEELVESIKNVQNQNQALREQVREMEQNQEYTLEQLGLLQLYVEAYRRLLDEDYSINQKMSEVEGEFLNQDNLGPSIRQYRKERID